MQETLVDVAGRAYGRKAAHPDLDLVSCRPGTQGGELLRRYWQPVALSSEASSSAWERMPRAA